MKNIISHNCVGAEFYKLQDYQYGNPFIWCVIPPDDFLYLHDHYGQIDFTSIELEKEGKFYKIVVDGKINVYYVHYKYNKNASTPTRQKEVDIVYDKIEEYIVEKYMSRLRRMHEKPVFIVTDREYITNKRWNFSKEDIENYLDKDDCIVAVYDRSIKGDNVVYLPEKNMGPKDIAKILADRI